VITLTKSLLDSLAIDADSHILIICPNWVIADRVMRIAEFTSRLGTVKRYPNGAAVRVLVIRDGRDSCDMLAGLRLTNVLVHKACLPELRPYLHSRIRTWKAYPHPMWLKEFTL
jgi:hypothetical protein